MQYGRCRLSAGGSETRGAQGEARCSTEKRRNSMTPQATPSEPPGTNDLNSSTREAVERLLDDRVRQGLPRTITDPAVLARVASILRMARGRNAA